jgi:hypothetical protein
VSEDTLQTFINECCAIGDSLSVASSAFIKAYQEWSGDGFKLTSKELKKQMEKKGFKVVHTKNGNVYERITFVGEGQGSGEGKTHPVKGGEGSENTFHAASEADLDSSGEGSEGKSHKVPHEGQNNNTASELSHFAFTAFTEGNSNATKDAPEADLQEGERKKSAFTTVNLPSPEAEMFKRNYPQEFWSNEHSSHPPEPASEVASDTIEAGLCDGCDGLIQESPAQLVREDSSRPLYGNTRHTRHTEERESTLEPHLEPCDENVTSQDLPVTSEFDPSQEATIPNDFTFDDLISEDEVPPPVTLNALPELARRLYVDLVGSAFNERPSTIYRGEYMPLSDHT